MNSKLMNWYFKVFSTNSNVNGYEVNNFPIPRIDKCEQKPFIEIVDKIFSITGGQDYVMDSGKKSAVQGCENKLDTMVYELYGLNQDEIMTIESSENG